MSEFTHLRMAIAYWRSRWEITRRDERGASAPEYLVLLLGILAIAGIAIIAVRTFVTNKGNELNGK
jgi:Flp pilus assembly pilin Flp